MWHFCSLLPSFPSVPPSPSPLLPSFLSSLSPLLPSFTLSSPFSPSVPPSLPLQHLVKVIAALARFSERQKRALLAKE